MPPEQQKQQTLHTLLTIFYASPPSSPCSLSWKTCTGSIPPRWNCSDSWWIKVPPPVSSPCLPVGPTSARPGQGGHTTQVTVPRLPQRQAVEVIHQVAHGKVLPSEVVEQIVAKTDGVPLFVEELTKMVLESGLLQEWDDRYELTSVLCRRWPSRHPARLADGPVGSPGNGEGPRTTEQLGARIFL